MDVFFSLYVVYIHRQHPDLTRTYGYFSSISLPQHSSLFMRQSGNLYVTRSRFSLSIDRVWSEPMGLALKLVWIFNFIVRLVPSIIETNWWFSRWTLLQAGIIVSDEFNKGDYRYISKIWIILVKLIVIFLSAVWFISSLNRTTEQWHWCKKKFLCYWKKT